MIEVVKLWSSQSKLFIVFKSLRQSVKNTSLPTALSFYFLSELTPCYFFHHVVFMFRTQITEIPAIYANHRAISEATQLQDRRIFFLKAIFLAATLIGFKVSQE